jgi:hypothetical protein
MMNLIMTWAFLRLAHNSSSLGQWRLGPFSLLCGELSQRHVGFVDQQVPRNAWATSNASSGSGNGESSSELCPCEYCGSC